MAKKQFKAESKRLLDLMINSIYTHKEIFLRELISNASDAIDKLYFLSLTDDSVKTKKEDYRIRIELDPDKRTLTIDDNGIGMTEQELSQNLGTIAKSGSLGFKQENAASDDVNIIGQFGVGFYSAFMVADEVTVISRSYSDGSAHVWRSSGIDGYTVDECEKDGIGTTVILHIKPNTEEDDFDRFLQPYTIRSLVTKYSDYIKYPIVTDETKTVPVEGDDEESEKTQTVTETVTLNRMTPIWKLPKKEVTDEQYDEFYKGKFYDYEAPMKVIRYSTEGTATFTALLFIPSHAPYDFYSKEYEKGLQLYSDGVLVMDKCADLLPDHFNFVKGLVDSSDVSLNISRETLQHDSQVKLIAKNIEKKIKTELEKLLKDDREKYEKFFDVFGLQLKFGVYNMYGMHADELKDLLLFKSSAEKKYVTLAEYVSRLSEDDKTIYYACGDSIDNISALPQIDSLLDSGKEILYCTEYVDEFALKILREYDGRQFVNACSADSEAQGDLGEEVKQKNEDHSGMLGAMKDALSEKVSAVRFTDKLKKHPVSLSSKGDLSLGMEKVLNAMPGVGEDKVKAETVLEINESHPIADKLIGVFASTPEKIAKYAEALYAQARLAGGLNVDEPARTAELICELLSE